MIGTLSPIITHVTDTGKVTVDDGCRGFVVALSGSLIKLNAPQPIVKADIWLSSKTNIHY